MLFVLSSTILIIIVVPEHWQQMLGINGGMIVPLIIKTIANKEKVGADKQVLYYLYRNADKLCTPLSILEVNYEHMKINKFEN